MVHASELPHNGWRNVFHDVILVGLNAFQVTPQRLDGPFGGALNGQMESIEPVVSRHGTGCWLPGGTAVMVRNLGTAPQHPWRRCSSGVARHGRRRARRRLIRIRFRACQVNRPLSAHCGRSLSLACCCTGVGARRGRRHPARAHAGAVGTACPTALRCSPEGRAAELTTRPAGAAFEQPRPK